MGILEDIGATLSGAVESAKEGASDLISGALAGVESAIASAQAGIYSIIDTVETLPSLLRDKADWIVKSVNNTLGEAKEWMSANIFERLRDFSDRLRETYDSIKGLFDWIKDGLERALKDIGNLVRGGYETLTKTLGDTFEGIKNTVVEKINEFIASVKALVEDFGVMLLTVLDEFFKRLGEAFKVDPVEAAKAFIEMQKAFMKMRVQELVA